MLYLFNSAYRPLYVTNVLRTLALPQGCSNEYRYKHTGEFRYMSPAFYSGLKSIGPGEECLIIFIDRFGEHGYVYHPLRRGVFVTYRDVNEYIHFHVSLDAFIYPQKVADFNRDLVQTLGALGLPRLTDNDPRNTRDGYYAIRGPSIVGSKDDFKIGKSAWNSVVEEIAKTSALNTTATQGPIFLMLDINGPSKKSLVPSAKGENRLFEFHKGGRYELVVTYRFPAQRTDQSARGKIQLDFGESIKGQKDVVIDSHANSVAVPFVPRRHAEEDRGAIVISSAEAKNIVGDIRLEYELSESSSFWLQVAIALVLFSIVGTFIGTDLSTIQPLTVKGMWVAGR